MTAGLVNITAPASFRTVCYCFARQSGGHVTIASRLGGGTSVSIFLPAVTSSSPTVPQRPMSLPPTIPDSVGVLLVENDADVRATLLETLSSDHWDVTAVPTGEAAIAVLQQDKTIGFLVTDIGLTRAAGVVCPGDGGLTTTSVLAPPC